MSTFSVPIEIINKNMTDKYIELEKEHQRLDCELNKLSYKQNKLFEVLRELIHPRDKYYHAYTYNYEYFKDRKAWIDALTLQESVNQVVENEGVIQEVNAKYVEVREQLKEIYNTCGIHKNMT